MAGRILLNTSGAPFRVRPQSRARFDGMVDDGRMTGEDWLRGISNTVQLAKQVAPIVSPLLPSGQSVKETPFDRAATAATEAADTRFGQPAPVATPENHLAAPTGDPYAPFSAAVQAANAAQTPAQLLEAEYAAQAAQQRFPTSDMDFVPPLRQPEVSLRDQGLSLGAQPTPGLSLSGQPAPSPMSLRGPGMAQPLDATPAMQPDPQPTAQDTALRDAFAAGDIIGQAQQQVAGMPMFQTISEAQTALALASQSGDREAYRRTAEALEYSPLSDVAPLTVEDYITKSHLRRAKQALLAKYKAPAAPKPLSAKDRAYIANVESMMSKREQDANAKIAKQWLDEENAAVRRDLDRARLGRTKVGTAIDRVVLRNKDADIKAGISQKRATASQRWQAARKSRKFNDFMDQNPEVFEGIQLDKTLQATIARDAERYANQEEQSRFREDRKDKRTRSGSVGRGIGISIGTRMADLEGRLAGATEQMEADEKVIRAYTEGEGDKGSYSAAVKRQTKLKGDIKRYRKNLEGLQELQRRLQSAPMTTAAPTSTRKMPAPTTDKRGYE